MNPASAIPAQAQQAAQEAAPWIEKLARVGFVAKALLYMTIGALATSAALGLGITTASNARNGAVGSRGAMSALLGAPLGQTLLYIIAVGLFGYAAWRTIDAILNPEGKRGWKGVGVRVRSASIAIIHFGLALSAVRIAMGSQGAAQDGNQTRLWTGRALATPGGEIALYAIALGIVGYGLYQLYNAWRAKLDKRLALGRMAHRARTWVVRISRFGIAARGVVFVAMGGLLAKAVQAHDPAQAQTPAQSLGSLFDFGTIPYVIIAVGLIAYGVYQLINAKYRRIQVT
jgi:hypothetical protein